MLNEPTLRPHQTALQTEVQSIIQESSGGPLADREIFADITCGGGKSILPLIAFQELHNANVVDRLCVVCPKDNLVGQCAEGFEDPFFRSLLSHNFSVNEATNDIDPCRGTSGYATTYQAIGADRAGINYDEFRRSRYLLCLDEFHHVSEGSNWHRQLMPLYKQATFVLFMTGTLERHDGKKIAFLPYKEISNAV